MNAAAADGDANPPDKPGPAARRPNSGGKRSARKVSTEPGIFARYEQARRDRWNRNVRELLSNWPAWLISLAVHAVAFLLVGFLIYTRKEPDLPLVLQSGWVSAKVKAAAARDPVEIATAPVTVEPEPTRTGPRPKRATAPVEAAPAAPRVRQPLEVDVSQLLASRSEKAKADALGAEGESDPAEKVVAQALVWLKRVQQADGHWQLHEKRGKADTDPRYPDAGTIKTDTGATALALLCYLGAGQTHQSGTHSREIAKAVDWLLKRQQPEGLIYEREFDGPAPFYSHAQATIALAELLAMTGDEALRAPVAKALEYICLAQNPTTGGWKYRPGQPGGDLSVMGWQLMALQTGRAAGLVTPSEVFDGANLFLSQVEEQDGAAYRYDVEPVSKVTPAMTAEGLLCRQYLGWPADHPAMRAGVEYLLGEEFQPEWESGRRNVYHWYYATQTLHNLGGDAWTRWRASITKAIVPAQEKAGLVRGSFHPLRTEGHPDERAREGGRLYITCLSVLILETPYRHTPLFPPQTQE